MPPRLRAQAPRPPWADLFGIRSAAQVRRDVGRVLSHLPKGDRFTFSLETAALFRPELSFPAHLGFLPRDGMSPIFNLFDRVGGGRGFASTVTRKRMRDFRGGKLSYDEHDGTDFVCPPNTPIVAAAPGVVVAARDTWLRGGLTLCVDHGGGVVTQYTHLSALVAELGQPVERGQVIARSGFSGFDMTIGFPLVPPHLHFMAWVDGAPVDPFLAEGEAREGATWLERNAPLASPPLRGEKPLELDEVQVDARALEKAVSRCLDPAIHAELERAPSDAARAAVVEDSLHHDRTAWPDDARELALRPRTAAPCVRLSLPLSGECYRGARLADAPWTSP